MLLDDLAINLGGLTSAEVARRRTSGDTNRDPQKSSKAILVIIAENALTVFNAINALIIGALAWLYVVRDDSRLLLDSLGILTVVVANTLIAIVQETRAHRALERALLTMRPSANVIRDSRIISVDREDIVLSDLLLVRRGDVLAADGELVYTDELELDESLLTGEVHATETSVGRTVFAGTYCTAGVGVIRVLHVGAASMASRINAMAKGYSLKPSPLQRKVNRLFEAWLLIAVTIAGIEIAFHATSIWSNVDELRRIATLLVGLIPEGLVFFATITVTLSVVRMSRKGVVVQKLSALESFASADVVCMDKTGTLTENRLSVHGIEPLSAKSNVDCSAMLRAFGDATTDEGQLVEALRELPISDLTLNPLQRIAFSSARKFSALRTTDTPLASWLVLGAADVVLTTSHASWNDCMGLVAARGWQDMRLLVLAQCNDDNGSPALGADAQPICWCALDDSVRADSQSALDLFSQMDVRVIILTGDAPGPAVSALKHLGREVQPDQVVLGNDLANSSTDLQGMLAHTAVFARLLPEQKRDLIQALRSSHHTIMIGDGVNDLPAIKAADVGIAMERAAPITKEVADIVLDKAAFSVLPEMVGEGRAVIRTVLNVAKLFIAKNTVLVLMSVMASLDLIPFPLTPRRSAFMSILCVGLPAMLLASQGRLRRPVKSFYRELGAYVVMSSTAALVIACLVYFIISRFGLLMQNSNMVLTFTLLGSLVGSFMSADQFDGKTSRHTKLLAALLIAVAAAVSVSPASTPVINILQVFYEVPEVSTLMAAALIVFAVISLLVSAMVHRILKPWIFSPK